MQYYLNGFRPGDPSDSGASRHAKANPPLVNLPEKVDVLIVGCGPAGLTLAAQLAAFSDIKTCIIEQKSGPLLVGQADGISGRSSEIFQALGFSERVMKEAYFLKAITFWKHDEDQPGNIIRTSKTADGRDVFSEFSHVVLNQARVHDFLLDVMRKSPSELEPDYCRRLLDLKIEPTSDSNSGYARNTDSNVVYPVSATVERLDPEHDRQNESVNARYVVGCDGARSTVRRSLSLPARGDSANKAWGVMDVLVVTDFPDIRIKSVIQSATEGTLLIIPREGGYLVRVYIEMDQLSESERASNLNITSDRLIEAAQRILHPYTLEVKEVAWWSVYEIGQRLCDKFDNVSDEEIESRYPSVFIVGDACHTHSPKAGQGMNVSIHDGFNLGWKLASVIRGHSSPRILHTYSAERREVAKDLITFDRRLAKMFSAPVESSSHEENETASPTELQKYMVRHDEYVSGTMSKYGPSIISAAPTHQHLAQDLEIGKRFHSVAVVRLADAKPVHLGHVIEADGRWRLFAFASAEDPANSSSGIHKLAEFLENSVESPIRKYTPVGSDVDAVIDVLTIFQQDYRELAIETMPAFLWPSKGKYGLRDYEKMYCPDLERGEDVFDTRGINRDSGCMVVVRPDQHVAHVLPLDGFTELVAFFDGFMTL
jgi:2-polyprenyl-6-methoxyphenol hydroxylase-like FAD-dependent oxidoreductase